MLRAFGDGASFERSARAARVDYVFVLVDRD
jgi:hypothetical protein